MKDNIKKLAVDEKIKPELAEMLVDFEIVTADKIFRKNISEISRLPPLIFCMK